MRWARWSSRTSRPCSDRNAFASGFSRTAHDGVHAALWCCDEPDHRVVVGAIALVNDAPDHPPALRQIEEQVIENEVIAERRLRAFRRRVVKAGEELLPGGLVRAEPGVEVAARNAVTRWWDRLQQRVRLMPARGVAEQGAAKNADPVLEMRIHHEQAQAIDTDRGLGCRSHLSRAREHDLAHVRQRQSREDRVPADARPDTAYDNGIGGEVPGAS